MSAEFQPYVGPKPFEEPDKELFFGRDAEANDLFSLIVAHPAVLIYAQSGAGKTSLLNAKIIPSLKLQAYEVLPLARVQGIQTNRDTNIYVYNTLISWADGQSQESPELAQMSLAEFLRKRPHVQKVKDFPAGETANNHQAEDKAPEASEEAPELWELPRVAVFDQFEELFTSYPHRWEEREVFFKQIREALDDDYLLRVVFLMREDYVAELDPYVSLLPSNLRVRTRLERLTEKSALDAVVKPLQFTNRKYGKDVARTLVHNLMKSSNGQPGVEQFVEGVQLQVVCQNLWQSLKPEDTTITLDHLNKCGDVTQALMSFYERSIRTIVGEDGLADGTRRITEADLRRWFEKVLITPEKKRATVDRRKEQTGGMPNETIIVPLERVQLIKGEWRAGARWYELSHDRFIEPILTSNQKWLADQSAAEQIRQRLETRAVEYAQGIGSLLNQDELVEAKRLLAHQRHTKTAASPPLRHLIQASLVPEQRRKMRNMRLGVAALVIIVALMAFLTSFAVIASGRAATQRAEADRQGAIAREASTAAEDRRKEAETLRGKAEAAERVAKEDRDKAQDERDRAEMQRRAAEMAKREAVKARQEMEVQRALALSRLKEVEGFRAKEREANQREKDETAERLARTERLTAAESWNIYGWGRSDSGDLAEAIKNHKIAVDRYRMLKDPSGEANSLTYLARAYSWQAGGAANQIRLEKIARLSQAEATEADKPNKFKEAENAYLAALKIRETISPNKIELARANGELARLYDGQDNIEGDEKAEAPYRKAIEIEQKIFDEKKANNSDAEPEFYSELAKSYGALGGLYQQAGRYAEAEPLTRKALEILEQAPPSKRDNAARADSLNLLGLVLNYQGKYAEAEKSYTEAVEINKKEEKRGPTGFEVATNLHNLALVHLARAEYSKAREMEEAALRINKSAPVLNHDNLALSYMVLARINSDTDKYLGADSIKCDENNSGAEACFKLSTAEAVKDAGEKNRRTAIMKHYQADFYASQGNYERAEAIETEALAVLKEKYKPDHWLISRSTSTLAAIRAGQGKLAEAESLYQGALANLKEKLGPNHPEVSKTLAGLAKVYLTEQEFSKAEPLFKEAIAIRERVAADHPYLIDILENYATLLQQTHRDSEAKEMNERAQAIRARVKLANQK